MRPGKAGLIPRRAKSFWLAIGVLAFSLACRVASGQHYTYNQNGEFGSKFFQVINNTMFSKLDSTDDSFSIRFTALESITVDRVFLHYYANGSATFTVGIMADNGSGKPDGTFLASHSTNYTFGALTTWTPEIVFASPLNLASGAVYHIVTQPTSIQTTMDLRTYFALTVSAVRPFDRAYDGMLNIVMKLDGAAWTVKNWTPRFVLANGSSTGYVTGPGQPYTGIYQNALPMTGGGTAAARGQTFVITDKEIPGGARVSVTQVVVNVTKSGTVTNNILVELRDTNPSLTLLGSTILLNSQLDSSADTLSFSPPVPLTQGHKYLLAFEFVSAPPTSTSDKLLFEEGRSTPAWGPVTWGGTTDCVVVKSAASNSWTGFSTEAEWSDLWFGLRGWVANPSSTGTLMMVK